MFIIHAKFDFSMSESGETINIGYVRTRRLIIV